MPEAPEVANVLRSLKEQLTGLKVESASITHPKLSSGMDPEEFSRRIVGQTFESFDRLGKYLVFHMDKDDWISHLRMEGKWQVLDQLPEEEKERKHIHAVFGLSNGKLLCYRDTRKFGRMSLHEKKPDWRQHPVFDKIGYDAMDPDLSAKWLKEKTSNRKIPVKSALLDQSLIAGIGNIYADEILFLSRIHPQTPVKDLSLSQWQTLLDNTRKVLHEAYEAGGSTIRSFAYGNHQPGTYQERLQVHNRQDQPCPVCSHPVQMEKIGGRSTYFCPICQPLPEGLESQLAEKASAPSCTPEEHLEQPEQHLKKMNKTEKKVGQ